MQSYCCGLDPPTLLRVPTDKLYRDPPSYVIFNFQAGGSPEPTIDWYYNEERVIFNDRYNFLIDINSEMYFSFSIHMNHNGSLIILDTEYSDNGVYKAVASNGAGKVEASASLTIYYRKSIQKLHAHCIYSLFACVSYNYNNYY